MCPLTPSCFLLERFSSLALPHLLGTCLPSLWSALFPPHASALIPFSLAKVRFSLTLFLSHFIIGDLDRWLFSFWQRHLSRFWQLTLSGTEATLSFSAGQVHLNFSLKPAPFCKLIAGLGSTNTSAIFSVTFGLSLLHCPFRLSFYLKLSGRSSLFSSPVLSGYNKSHTLVSPGQ